MKRLSTLFIMLAIMLVGFNPATAQSFEGRIVYGIEYLELPAEMRGMEAMLPSSMEMFLKGSKIAMEQGMMGGTQTVIYDSEGESSYVLMDMMGMKVALEVTEEETQEALEEVGEPDIEYVNEVRDIAGYKCYKAIVSADSSSVEVWYTKEIQSANHMNFKTLDGFPLQYVSVDQGMKIQITANTIEKLAQPDAKFEIPEGYEIKTMEEFTKMMGGGR